MNNDLGKEVSYIQTGNVRLSEAGRTLGFFFWGGEVRRILLQILKKLRKSKFLLYVRQFFGGRPPPPPTSVLPVLIHRNIQQLCR